MEHLTIQVSLPPQPSRLATTFLSVLPLRLIRLRELRRISQRDLAAQSAVSRTQLNKIEGGLAGDVLVSTIERLGGVLLATPDALLGYDESELVRAAVRPGAMAPSVREAVEEHTCPVCEQLVGCRSMHLLGDCMVYLSGRGLSCESIAARFGLTAAAAEFILREEHTARRHRRF